MKIKRKICQTLIIIFVGNFNFFFIRFCVNAIDFKGILPFIIFLPYFFTIASIKLLIYDASDAKIKEMQNKIIRIILQVTLILSTLLISIALQTIIYYTIFEALST